MPATMPVVAQGRRGVDPGVHCLLIAVTGVIFFIVGQAWDSFRDPVSYPQVIAAVEPDATIEVHVEAVIIPASATVTAIPTARPTDAPTVAPGLNWCSTPVAGKVCEVPPKPTATATAYPDCADMASLEPKDLCRWR